MKYAKHLLTVCAAFAGLVLVTNTTVQAQSLAMRVQIPFEFHAGEKVLPAGTYIIQRRGDAITVSDGRGNATAAIANAVPNKSAKLDDMVVFHRYGDLRFLTEVRWRGYSTARGLTESKAESRLAKAIAVETEQLAAITR